MKQFVIGGTTVAGISYLGNNVNPVLAGIFASIPIGLPSGYFILNEKGPEYYTHLIAMTTVLFLATFVTYYLIVNYKMDKNKAIGFGMMTWVLCGILYYFYKMSF